MATYTSSFTDDHILHEGIGKKKVSGLAFPRLECLTNVAGRWKAIFLSSETSKWALDTHPAL
jgi:hypothetical protein